MSFLANKRVVLFSMIATIIMAFVVMAIVDPMIDKDNGLGVIALQLAFDKGKGVAIVSSWDIAAFQQWIFTDYLYAFCYALFFASLLIWLEKVKGVKRSIFPYVAILAGFFDWTENSLELWFLHDPAGFPPVLFFVHSCLAALKWLALPVVLGRIVQLYRRKWKDEYVYVER